MSGPEREGLKTKDHTRALYLQMQLPEDVLQKVLLKILQNPMGNNFAGMFCFTNLAHFRVAALLKRYPGTGEIL